MLFTTISVFVLSLHFVDGAAVQPQYKRSLDSEVKWEKVGTDVCYHGNHDSFGVIMIKKTGFLKAMKLVHKEGAIQCSATDHGTNWGCNDHTKLNVFVTDSKKHVIFPAQHEVKPTTAHWYTIPGILSTNDDLVLKNFCYPVYVREMDILQIWWGEDLENHSYQNDNSGRTCVDVYAAFDSSDEDIF